MRDEQRRTMAPVRPDDGSMRKEPAASRRDVRRWVRRGSAFGIFVVALLCSLAAPWVSGANAQEPPGRSGDVATASRQHPTAVDPAGRIDSLERDVDTIQNKLIKSDAPFYATSSFWISIAALAFSIGTTVWSSIKADAQERQAARQELRGLLQRLAALPKENVEAMQKYASDPLTANLIGSMIAQENSMLARQAADIARKLPQDVVSPTEYYAIAMALENAYEYNTTRELLERSITTAEARRDFISEISALRSLGYLCFVIGKPDEGRVVYGRAQAIFTRYAGFDVYTQVNTNFLTELNWASAETIAREPDAVRQHLDAASSLLDGLTPSPGLDNMRQQLHQAKSRFGAMGVIPKPTVPAMETAATAGPG